MSRAPHHCRHCDRPLRPKGALRRDHPGTVLHVGRGLCSNCYRQHRSDYDRINYPADELLAEVDHLAHYPAADVAERLGVTLSAIAGAGYRHGRPDIGARFARAHKQHTGAAA